MPLSAARETLGRAETRRAADLSFRTLDVWRWINGPGDGAPSGLTIDRYGAWLVVGAREHVGEEVVQSYAAEAHDQAKSDGVVLKRLARSVKDSTSAVLLGTLPEGGVRVREEGATFLCDLNDGISTGLFIDQREVRLRARELARDRDVLNLFAYTCAFSVHAALGGARRVTSVDVSKRALRRGRENMKASGLDADRHRWFDDDVFELLARQRKKAPSYGLVILDPPVFGHARGAAFSLETSVEELLAGGIAATLPGGTLIFSTHLLSIDETRVLELARSVARELGRSISAVETMGLPAWDHPVLDARTGAEDRGNYLKTLVLRVG
jgi:23S rRNA (cytosine1962-C5)-methyltransferase